MTTRGAHDRNWGTNKNVLSREGRYLGVRHVLYCPSTKMYVSGDCRGTTSSRFWAWSGTPRQAERTREEFGIGQEYELFVDGKEKRIE